MAALTHGGKSRAGPEPLDEHQRIVTETRPAHSLQQQLGSLFMCSVHNPLRTIWRNRKAKNTPQDHFLDWTNIGHRSLRNIGVLPNRSPDVFSEADALRASVGWTIML